MVGRFSSSYIKPGNLTPGGFTKWPDVGNNPGQQNEGCACMEKSVGKPFYDFSAICISRNGNKLVKRHRGGKVDPVLFNKHILASLARARQDGVPFIKRRSRIKNARLK